MKISNRTNHESYGMRGSATYASDRVRRWERRINGTAYEFSHIAWRGGRDGHTVRVHLAGTTTVVHEWVS